jgi:CDP-diacylglycerol---glycerol-3-phosphate 3-phosphatidyltransferase
MRFVLVSSTAVLFCCESCASFLFAPPLTFCKVKQEAMRTKRILRLVSDDNELGNPIPKQHSRLGEKAPPPGLLRKAFPKMQWRRLPNWLTYVRCCAIPALALLFYIPDSHVATSVLFAVASLTDWLDGFLARRWDITSAFGTFLDPVADKLLISTALILLSGRYGAVVALPTAVILAREIAVSALREWMSHKGLRDSVQVGFQGKVKAAVTMMSLTLLLVVPGDGKMAPLVNLYLPAIVSLYVCAVLTVTSGGVYFRAAAPILFDNEES